MYNKSKFLIFAAIACTAASAFALGNISAQEEALIPDWIKTTAGFWVNDQISDEEFLFALQYLLNNGLLNIPAPGEDIIKTSESDAEPETSTVEQPEEPGEHSDLELLQFKIEQIQELAEHPEIIQAIKESNKEFDEMDDPFAYIEEQQTAWHRQSRNQNSEFMNSLMQNDITEILRTKSVIPTQEFGDVLFPEIILTNEYGANVAITTRTSDYNQGQDIWWIKAKKTSVQIRDVEWDISAGIYSGDIVIRVDDEKGKFIGVINAATPAR